jgi:hypothetical protein
VSSDAYCTVLCPMARRGVSAKEQRALVGDAWPVCECGCGEPMLWHQDARMLGGGSYQCAVRGREYKRAYRLRSPEKGPRERFRRRYAERKDRGVCARCEGPLLSEVYCWDCLNKKERGRWLQSATT